jgi:hypothetical protein
MQWSKYFKKKSIVKKNHVCGVKKTQPSEAKLDVISTQKPNAQSQSFYIIQQKSKDLGSKWNVWLLQAKCGQNLHLCEEQQMLLEDDEQTIL